uniref:type IV pilus modification PilV family protein n=2 Tax=Candidatus Ichthyocystis TaxID=2929841 RepID=UPI001F5ED4E1
MKSYYYITRKEKGSFLIEVLLSMLILTGSILGVFKLIANNDNAEYDYIQRMVISTEIYNY